MADTKRNLTLALQGEDRTTIEQIIEDHIGIVLNGSYVPTFTDLVNMDSISVAGNLKYSRSGNIVTVFGRFSTNATATATESSFKFNPPIASAMVNDYEASGMLVEQISGATDEYSTGAVFSDGEGKIACSYVPKSGGIKFSYINFSYLIR